MLKTGDRLGDYEILALLGSGGMASLYVARHRGAADFERNVAIKVVHPHLARDATFLAMFVDEAKLAERVRHPNVVHVEALGEHDGSYFLAMEHVDGAALDELLEVLAQGGRGLSPPVAVSIAVAMADALHAAHETLGADGEPLGIVHRDISPHNVLVSRSGHVKVIDFGIAKAKGRSHSTTTGTIKGKYAYMSPEQASALPVDRRTDIYALGIVLWEMLTMEPLFDGDSEVEILDLVRRPDVQPPGSRVPGVPPALDAVVLQALAPSPEGRPSTARELRQALLRAVPEAATIDATALAELMEDTLGPLLDERRSLLRPPSRQGGVDAQARTVPAAPTPPMGAMTVPRADAALHAHGPRPLPETAARVAPAELAPAAPGPGRRGIAWVGAVVSALVVGGAGAWASLAPPSGEPPATQQGSVPSPVEAPAAEQTPQEVEAGSPGGEAPEDEAAGPDAGGAPNPGGAGEPTGVASPAGAEARAGRRRGRRSETTTSMDPADVIDGVPIVTEY